MLPFFGAEFSHCPIYPLPNFPLIFSSCLFPLKFLPSIVVVTFFYIAVMHFLPYLLLPIFPLPKISDSVFSQLHRCCFFGLSAFFVAQCFHCPTFRRSFLRLRNFPLPIFSVAFFLPFLPFTVVVTFILHRCYTICCLTYRSRFFRWVIFVSRFSAIT